jgi:hypothetical protein
MQFDIDMQGPFSDLFLHIRDILLSYDGVKEHLTEHQTTFKYKNRGICMMRSKESHFVLAFNFGDKIHTKYKELYMTGKIVAHWTLYKTEDFDESVFKQIIHDSIGYILEAHALKKMKTKPSV